MCKFLRPKMSSNSSSWRNSKKNTFQSILTHIPSWIQKALSWVSELRLAVYQKKSVKSRYKKMKNCGVFHRWRPQSTTKQPSLFCPSQSQSERLKWLRPSTRRKHTATSMLYLTTNKRLWALLTMKKMTQVQIATTTRQKKRWLRRWIERGKNSSTSWSSLGITKLVACSLPASFICSSTESGWLLNLCWIRSSIKCL